MNILSGQAFCNLIYAVIRETKLSFQCDRIKLVPTDTILIELHTCILLLAHISGCFVSILPLCLLFTQVRGILFLAVGRQKEILRLQQLNLKHFMCLQSTMSTSGVGCLSLQGFVALPWIFSMNSLHSVSIRYVSYTPNSPCSKIYYPFKDSKQIFKTKLIQYYTIVIYGQNMLFI